MRDGLYAFEQFLSSLSLSRNHLQPESVDKLI